ncbi:MAG: sigma-70 family RNA polymerase sigma factor [Candidatus Hydrogenedentes bacterium]|nr:sigma-70 family RNA polymerase sigma factor [Candidatus Hydrogenedentota bacterium]
MKTPETIRTESLVLRAQTGDAEGFAELVETWQAGLWSFARVLTGHDESAWDVTQEVWLAVVRELPQLQDPARFPAWIFRIARNKAADLIRRRSRQRAYIQDRADADRMEARNDPIEVRDVLESLPQEEASLLALHYLQGFGYEELAGILGIPLGTVKSRLHKARQTFRARLEQDHE